jgi:hypothetical protein
MRAPRSAGRVGGTAGAGEVSPAALVLVADAGGAAGVTTSGVFIGGGGGANARRWECCRSMALTTMPVITAASTAPAIVRLGRDRIRRAIA